MAPFPLRKPDSCFLE